MSLSSPREGQEMRSYHFVASGYSDTENRQISWQMSCTFVNFNVCSQLCHLLLNHHCVLDTVIYQSLLICVEVEVGMLELRRGS